MREVPMLSSNKSQGPTLSSNKEAYDPIPSKKHHVNIGETDHSTPTQTAEWTNLSTYRMAGVEDLG